MSRRRHCLPKVRRFWGGAPGGGRGLGGWWWRFRGAVRPVGLTLRAADGANAPGRPARQNSEKFSLAVVLDGTPRR